MNRAIFRLFGVMTLLFVLLVAFTSRWTIFDQKSLDNNPLNNLALYASEKVKSGELLADNGDALAKSVPAGGGTWSRTYPFGPLFSQTVGYSIPSESSSAGLEEYHGTALHGIKSALTGVFGSFGGNNDVGDDVQTTLNIKAQKLARTLVQNAVVKDHALSGSVVAIVPQTGAVKVMYSDPTYNDNDPTACGKTPGCSEYFDATEGEYPPGSTFKLVTTAAALDSGKYTPESVIDGHSPIIVSGKSLQNDDGDEYGDVSLTEALTYSINVVYAQVGEKVGPTLMQKYMERFGFYSEPPMDYPAGQMVASGERFYPGSCGNNKRTLLLPVTNSCVDIGRTAIGQANLTVTPLQMAMVVSAVADDGKLMEPRLATEAVNQDGQVVERFRPTEYDQVMKPKIALEEQAMMRDVVEEGTGTAANLDGLNIAGKTGTASTYTKDGVPYDDAWFVGFPEGDPKIAVAVELTDIPNGYGGTYAAPIAAQVIKTLLGEK